MSATVVFSRTPPDYTTSIRVLMAILHKELKLSGSLHRTLQALSVHHFEKIRPHPLLTETPDN